MTPSAKIFFLYPYLQEQQSWRSKREYFFKFHEAIQFRIEQNKKRKRPTAGRKEKGENCSGTLTHQVTGQ
jgi:hypothetical protein